MARLKQELRKKDTLLQQAREKATDEEMQDASDSEPSITTLVEIHSSLRGQLGEGDELTLAAAERLRLARAKRDEAKDVSIRVREAEKLLGKKRK